MPATAKKPATLPAGHAGILSGIVALLDAARQAAARSVNALMTASYWDTGRRIVEVEQKGRRRAGDGEQWMGLRPGSLKRACRAAPLPTQWDDWGHV